MLSQLTQEGHISFLCRSQLQLLGQCSLYDYYLFFRLNSYQSPKWHVRRIFYGHLLLPLKFRQNQMLTFKNLPPFLLDENVKDTRLQPHQWSEDTNLFEPCFFSINRKSVLVLNRDNQRNPSSDFDWTFSLVTTYYHLVFNKDGNAKNLSQGYCYMLAIDMRSFSLEV